MRAGFSCALETEKFIPKTAHESCLCEKKTGVESAMMAGNKHQKDDII